MNTMVAETPKSEGVNHLDTRIEVWVPIRNYHVIATTVDSLSKTQPSSFRMSTTSSTTIHLTLLYHRPFEFGDKAPSLVIASRRRGNLSLDMSRSFFAVFEDTMRESLSRFDAPHHDREIEFQ